MLGISVTLSKKTRSSDTAERFNRRPAMVSDPGTNQVAHAADELSDCWGVEVAAWVGCILTDLYPMSESTTGVLYTKRASVWLAGNK